MPYYQSPLNYTGGKYKLLPQIEPLFPQNIDTFVDLFCGGGSVGASVNCNHIVFNDSDTAVIGLLKMFRHYDVKWLERTIKRVISNFGLSMVCQNGYEFYGCNSCAGLGIFNREPFNQLKCFTNRMCRKDSWYYLHLYILIVYAFNNQIRFNNTGEYNLPVGKRDFNEDMQTKLRLFVARLQQMDCDFKNKDFSYFSPDKLTIQDFVYADPPYLITCATYNEKGGWREVDEHRLLKYLDELSAHNIRFALSNVLTSKGRTNTILQEWLVSHDGEYTCHHLNYNYSNSNYHTTDRTTGSDEVLITNY